MSEEQATEKAKREDKTHIQNQRIFLRTMGMTSRPKSCIEWLVQKMRTDPYTRYITK